jgi:hypothetical protein
MEEKNSDMALYDIIIRKYLSGFIAALIIDGKKLYRTGEYKSSAVAALTDVQFWMQHNLNKKEKGNDSKPS